MQRHNKLVFYRDRMAVAQLHREDAPLLDAMRAWQIGKVDQKQRIHFCGLIHLQDGRNAVFLPHGMPVGDIGAASLTLASLSRYGHDAASRMFDTDGGTGNPGALAIIARLAADFQQNGLFVERQRIHTRNTGKPDWKRTVTREAAFAISGVGIVYPDIATTKALDSNETLLAQIQAVIMAEIIEDHGWWLTGVGARRSDLRWIRPPRASRNLWPAVLDGLLPRLYGARSIFLATYLAHYLRDCRASDTGTFVFGVQDFHTVWEAMLRGTLANVAPHWNARLPKAVYETVSGAATDAPRKGMLTDIILHDARGYTVVDAKYYAARTAATVPGWPDIAKQIVYETALRSVVGAQATVQNCFVFPALDHGTGPFSTVAMRHADGGAQVAAFPQIQCRYMSMRDVMTSYRDHRAHLTL